MHFIAWLLLLPGLAAAQTLVLIGGNVRDDNAEVYNAMIEAAGGKDKARIGVMPTANSSPVTEGNLFVGVFRDLYGVNATYIPITRNSGNVNDPAIVDLIRQQTGIFFVGGNRPRVVYTLRPGGTTDSLAMTAIREVLRGGGMVAGTSAGMGCFSNRAMIIDGGTWSSLAEGVFANTGYSNKYPNNMAYDPNGGLGLLDDFVLDTHFSEMGREGRLIKVVQETRDIATGTTRGLGVDEDTALFVTGLDSQPKGKVVGTAGGVFYVDVKDLISTPSDTTDYQVAVSFLTSDDVIDLKTGDVTFASWKANLAGAESWDNAISSNDIFSERSSASAVWRSTAARLVDNKNDQVVSSFSYTANPRFEVVLDKRTATAFGADLPTDSKTFVASYTNMLVTIRPS